MKLLFGVVLTVLFVIQFVRAAPPYDDIEIDSESNSVSKDAYEFSYALSDETSRSEKGKLTKVGDAEVYEVSGSYSFEGDNGLVYTVTYTSGVNGYRATVTAEEPKEKEFEVAISPDAIKSLVG